MRLDHALGHAGPEELLGGIVVGDDEDQVGVGAEVELAHAQPAQRDHHHLVAGVYGAARRAAALRASGDAVSRGDHGSARSEVLPRV